MKILVTAVLLLVLSGVPLPNRTGLVPATGRKARLQLTTSIVSEKSCSQDHLSLDLSLPSGMSERSR